MIRVAHVLWKAEFGGIEKLVLDLAAEQARDPDLHTTVYFGSARGTMLQSFRDAGVRTHEAGFERGYSLSPVKIQRTAQFLRTHDLVHTHTFVLPMALAQVRSGCPIIFTQHGNFGIGRKRKIGDAVKSILLRVFLNRHVRHLTFNSDFSRRLWSNRMPRIRTPSRVVPNGVRWNGVAQHKAPDIEAWANGSFVVGTSSRFATVKRIDRLIESFARFSQGRNAKLLLVGDGPLRVEFEKRIAALGLSSCTLFTGYRQDVRACQATMDVCAFPSTHESFGLACAETLGLGKPTIVFEDGGGMVDLVRAVSPDDVVCNEEELARRLAFYYDNPGLREADSSRRQEYARTFDIRNTAAQFKQLYQSLIRPEL